MEHKIDKKREAKLLEIELDIYERYYVTVNNLNYITYTDQYVSGFVGDLPGRLSSTPVCVKYVKKLLLLFDRIKQHLKLFVPTQFNKQDVIKLYWKIINDVATLDSLLLYNSKFAIIYKERVNNFEEEMKKENILNQCCIPLKNIKCLINKIQRIS